MWNRDRALFVVTRDDAMAVTGSIGAIVFSHREPILGLRLSEQQLLTAALKVSTDEELARELRLKLPTVKKRWASAFERISLTKPDLIPTSDRSANCQTRGRQKRHLLLAYVRQHPEELRPYLAKGQGGPESEEHSHRSPNRHVRSK
jgi:hypothetical protein